MNYARTLSWIGLLALLVAPPAQAQSFGGQVEASGVPYHVFTRPGEPTIEVMVMGSGSAGIYKIGIETNLGELLALTSGGALSSESARQRTNVTIRLYRTEEGARTVIYEEEMEDALAAPSAYPDLQDGDVLVVETRVRERFGWRDGLRVLTSLSSLILLVDRLRRL